MRRMRSANAKTATVIRAAFGHNRVGQLERLCRREFNQVQIPDKITEPGRCHVSRKILKPIHFAHNFKHGEFVCVIEQTAAAK